MNRLLIVIPAYNEEESIEEVVNNIKENYSQFDYVIVNDGSKDSTYSVCEKNKYNIIKLGNSYCYMEGLYEKGIIFSSGCFRCVVSFSL